MCAGAVEAAEAASGNMIATVRAGRALDLTGPGGDCSISGRLAGGGWGAAAPRGRGGGVAPPPASRGGRRALARPRQIRCKPRGLHIPRPSDSSRTVSFNLLQPCQMMRKSTLRRRKRRLRCKYIV
ncbi:uncharacterized protein LOC126095678 [Schistocerca cancellata]|uniref:uncharacterized protein LOC126095678 n=1 Tax=Schistocerca cancellata TaxID=274614 RepID=UPI00211885B1|nr:uncharacterized protein LOC126095678 [Schistocerca cancellata]